MLIVDARTRFSRFKRATCAAHKLRRAFAKTSPLKTGQKCVSFFFYSVKRIANSCQKINSINDKQLVFFPNIKSEFLKLIMIGKLKKKKLLTCNFSLILTFFLKAL